jgi:peptidoglycan/xylan/chitin deacetylase (PgdA/CDA1 family)
MRHLSIVTVALVAIAIDSPSPASAHACIQDQYGRVVCGPVVARYPGGRYDDRYDQYAASPIGYCPPGTVAGNFACIPWRAPLGTECPPNRWLVDGFCRPYSHLN